MGRLKHLGMSLLLATTFFSCGDDYDDTALRNDVNDLKSRVEKLEYIRDGVERKAPYCDYEMSPVSD